MSYTILLTNGTVLTTIPDGTINTTSTSLGLPGRNYAGYGQPVDENFVWLTENFAATVPPANPLTGQLWYNTNNQTMYICPAAGTTNASAWLALSATSSGGTTTFGNITATGNITANNATITNAINANSITVNFATVSSNLVAANANVTTANVGTLFTQSISTGAQSTPGTLTGVWTANGSGIADSTSGTAMWITGGNLLIQGGGSIGIRTDNYYYANGTPINFSGSYGNANVAAYLPVYGGTLLASNITATSALFGAATGGFMGPGTVNATQLYVNGVAVGTGGGGGVSSVSGTGSVNGITLTGTVTTSGSLTLGGSLTGVNLTSQVTGTLPVLNGGTGVTTPSLVAGTNITITGVWPNQTINSTGGGGGGGSLVVGSTAVTGGTNGYLLYNNAGVLGVLGTTGTGPVVLASSPTLVTPSLGTPASGTLTNCTGYTATNLSGQLNLATQVTGTLPVTNGGTGTTTSTGTGKVVLATSPSLVTPALGTPVSGNLSSCTGYTYSNLSGSVPTWNQNTSGTSGGLAGIPNITVGTITSGAVTVSGAITATGNITAYYSDDRLKTKLGVIPNALDKVKSLEGFYYQANEVAQALGYEVKREVGVSAQSVQAVMAEVVAPAPIDPQYLTVQYEKLVPLLIEAIKELTAKVEALEAKSN